MQPTDPTTWLTVYVALIPVALAVQYALAWRHRTVARPFAPPPLFDQMGGNALQVYRLIVLVSAPVALLVAIINGVLDILEDAHTATVWWLTRRRGRYEAEKRVERAEERR